MAQKLSTVDMRRKIAAALRLTELSGLEQRPPTSSPADSSNVSLARALVMEPKVLLFDEPLSNLDAKLREQMRAEIRRIQQTLGITSVYVTHDQAEAMTLSDRIVVMNQGRIVQIGTAPRDLSSASQYASWPISSARPTFLAHVVGAFSRGTSTWRCLGATSSSRPTMTAWASACHVAGASRSDPGGIQWRWLFRSRTSHRLPWAMVEYDIEVAGTVLS